MGDVKGGELAHAEGSVRHERDAITEESGRITGGRNGVQGMFPIATEPKHCICQRQRLPKDEQDKHAHLRLIT